MTTVAVHTLEIDPIWNSVSVVASIYAGAFAYP
jgi:hypothetical protein